MKKEQAGDREGRETGPEEGAGLKWPDRYIHTAASLTLTATQALSWKLGLYSPPSIERNPRKTHINLQSQNSRSTNMFCTGRGILGFPLNDLIMSILVTFEKREDGWGGRRLGRKKRSGPLPTILWKMSITNRQVGQDLMFHLQGWPFPEKPGKCHPVMLASLPYQGVLFPPSPPRCFPPSDPLYHFKTQINLSSRIIFLRAF